MSRRYLGARFSRNVCDPAEQLAQRVTARSQPSSVRTSRALPLPGIVDTTKSLSRSQIKDGQRTTHALVQFVINIAHVARISVTNSYDFIDHATLETWANVTCTMIVTKLTGTAVSQNASITVISISAEPVITGLRSILQRSQRATARL